MNQNSIPILCGGASAPGINAVIGSGLCFQNLPYLDENDYWAARHLLGEPSAYNFEKILTETR